MAKKLDPSDPFLTVHMEIAIAEVLAACDNDMAKAGELLVARLKADPRDVLSYPLASLSRDFGWALGEAQEIVRRS